MLYGCSEIKLLISYVQDFAMPSPEEKVMIFIDSANLFKPANEMGFKIDYVKVKNKLTGSRNLIRAYFFDAVPYPLPPPKASFLDALRHNGITVITKELKKRKIVCQNCVLAKKLVGENPEIKFPNEKTNGNHTSIIQDYQKGVGI